MDTITTSVLDSNNNSNSIGSNNVYYVYQDNHCEIVGRHERFSFIQKRKDDVTNIIAKTIENYNEGRLIFYRCEYLDDFLMKHKERKLPIDMATHFGAMLNRAK